MNLQSMQTSGKARFGALLVTCGAALSVFVTHAFALGLGEPHVASVLGQPLQMTVPLMMDTGTQLTQECVRIIPGRETGETTPSLNTGRISIDAANRQLRIESLTWITEPTLKVAVEVGCNERIRREFTLLMDPPVVAPGVSSGVADSVQPVSSLGLGMAQISAVVGQRLTLKVPVVGPGADSLTAGCVHLADPIASEGVPVLRQADIRVLPQDGGSLIELATPETVTESAVRLALDVGCQDPVRREYAILLGMPALAASNVDTSTAAAEPAPSESTPKPAAKRVTKARKDAPAAPAAPESSKTRTAPAERLEPSTKVAQAVASGSDRLVLGSADEDAGSAALGSDLALGALDQSAELAKRLDAMSRQIEALQAQLLASRQHEQELERRAAETREEWTWSMAGLAALLLVGALLMAWRHRPMPQAAWEPAVSHVPEPIAPRPAAPRVAADRAANHFDRESSAIAGRATMPGRVTTPAPISAAITEPSLSDDKNSQITVTELHDTVQVIKELYATVLERNTSNTAGASSRGKPSRPLELDLRTPEPMDAPGGSAHPLAASFGSELSDMRASEVRFTELPTEVGLDLDLSSVVGGAPQVVLSDLLARAERAASPIHQPAVAAAAAAHATAQIAASASTFADPALPVVGVDVGADRPGPAGHGPLSDENLTQTPTEVLLDLDVGTATGFSHSNRPTLEPIDLQLDLSQPQVRSGPRAGRIA